MLGYLMPTHNLMLPFQSDQRHWNYLHADVFQFFHALQGQEVRRAGRALGRTLSVPQLPQDAAHLLGADALASTLLLTAFARSIIHLIINKLWQCTASRQGAPSGARSASRSSRRTPRTCMHKTVSTYRTYQMRFV